MSAIALNPGAIVGDAADRPAINPWFVALTVTLATFMELLDTSIANVALPNIAGGLASGVDEATWVLTSYLVANAVVLPLSAWLSEIIGRKRYYLICVALFTGSSFLCGIAPNLGSLIFFRILQGIGGGGLAPTEQSILADTFSPAQRSQAFALYGIAVVVAPTLGPTLGGWITDSFSWRWIFLINVPVCALSLFLAGSFLVDSPAIERDRKQTLRGGVKIDYLGFALVAIGLGCLQIVLDKGQEDDWFASDFVLSLSLVSVLSLIALVIWELGHEDPIVDIPLFKDKSFAASMTAMFVTGFILISTTQMLPQFLQTLMGYTATQAGLALTAGGLATLVMMPVVGVLTKSIQPKYMIAFGLTIEAIACYHLSGLTTDVSFSHVAWARVVQAAGLPFLFVPISSVAYAGLPPEKNNSASALTNTMRNLGGSFGISLSVALLGHRGQYHQSRLVDSVDAFVPAHPTGQAGLLNLARAIGQQAQMMSYIDVFWVLTIIAAAAVPLMLLLLRRVKLGETAAVH